MSFILGLDQGTTSSRAMVFDRSGAIKAVAQKEFRQIFPQPGWVERPDEIWETQIGVAVEAIARAGVSARYRRDRYYQSARDNGRMGSPYRRARVQCDRMAGPAHRRRLRNAQSAWT